MNHENPPYAIVFVSHFASCSRVAAHEGIIRPLIITNLLTHASHRPVPNYLTATVETVLAIHREERSGDVLAFLTGQEEVEKAVSELKWVY